MKNFNTLNEKDLENIFPTCCSLMGPDAWDSFIASFADNPMTESVPEALSIQADNMNVPEFIPELARLEWAVYETEGSGEISNVVDRLQLNPSLQLLHLSWKNLVSLIRSDKGGTAAKPEQGDELAIIWRVPKTGMTGIEVASEEDLLVLKIVVEELSPEMVADEGGLPIGAIDRALDRAVRRGILLAPESRILRGEDFPKGEGIDDRFFTPSVFTLQWHITQACDLHCKHCYDRSSITSLPLD